METTIVCCRTYLSGGISGSQLTVCFKRVFKTVTARLLGFLVGLKAGCLRAQSQRPCGILVGSNTSEGLLASGFKVRKGLRERVV